jgi:flagellum-specific peptidoglycan hydrolase FlgJ
VTDNTQTTKIGNGNSNLSSTQMAPRVSNFNLRVSADSPHLTPQQLQFLLRVTPPALQSQREHEVPACVAIAQAILESATAAGWGSSSLFRLANNPFGIKYEHFGSGDRVIGPTPVEGLRPAGGRSGNGVSNGENPSPNARIIGSNHPFLPAGDQEKAIPPITRLPDHPIPQPYGHFDAQTWEIENGQKKVMIAQFQRFPNLTQAFIAHAQLMQSPRYRPAFDVRHDWKQFAERLGPKASPLDSEHCGYSTNPSYSAELIKLVNLYRLNDPRAVEWYATGRDPGNRAIEPSDHRVIESSAQRSIGASAIPRTDEPMDRSSGQSARTET